MWVEEKKFIFGQDDLVEISSAFAYNLKSQKIHQLLVPGKDIALQRGLGTIVGVSPDKKYVYMPAYKEAGKSMRTNGRMVYSLVKADLTKYRRPGVVEKGHEDTVKYLVGRKGNVIAEYRFDDHQDRYSIVAYDKKKEREIYSYKAKLSELSVVGITEDEESLVISKYSDKTGYDSYHTMSLADGSITDHDVLHKNADVARIYKDLNQHVFGIRYSGLFPSYHFFDETLNARVQKITADFDGHSVFVSGFTPDKSHMIIYVEGSTAPGDYYVVKSDGSITFIMSARSNIAPEDVHPIATYKFTTSDGLTIPTILTIPKDHVATMKNLPAIMLPHGGPESYDQVSFDYEAQALANRGYLVIQPNFRGSSGFGSDHRDAGHGEWGKKMQDDLSEALSSLVKRGLVDPDRVCIVGGSYGGYAALAGGAFTPSLYKCVVSINGVSDLPKMISQEKSDHGRNSWILDYWDMSMLNNDGGKKAMKAVSPARHAESFTAPVLLIHGNKDKTVNFEQSKYMYKQLSKYGKSVELVKLKGEDHHLSKSETRLEALEALLAFVDTHIGQESINSEAK
ncbi:MAG: pimeloyl-ACP methyl ester carboxylesterase [Flavobacteriales bacterium]|jgi:pimeloyl-ACP methyl ester carboxylesterase